MDDRPPVTLSISGMSCGHCVASVQKSLASVPGIATSRVTIGSAALVLEPSADANTAVAAALAAIENAGYQATRAG